MLTRVLLLVFAILCHGIAYTQTVVEVVDAATQKPLHLAHVVYNGKHQITDIHGHFILPVLSKTPLLLEIRFMGYHTYSKYISKESFSTKSIALIEATTTLQEVVLTDGREKIITQSPVFKQYIDTEFLQKKAATSLMQTLAHIPGVSASSIGATQSKPTIRGLGGNRVVVAQNGIKHQAQQWGADHGLEINSQGVSQLEIIKGPSALLFGSDAIAGAIHILPYAIPEKYRFYTKANLEYASVNQLQSLGVHLQARPSNWYYILDTNVKTYEDYKVPATTIHYDNYVFSLANNRLRNTAGKQKAISGTIGYVAPLFKNQMYYSGLWAKNGFFANAHGQEVRVSQIDYDASNKDIDLPYHTVRHLKLINTTTFLKPKSKTKLILGYQNNKREEHTEPTAHGYMPNPEKTKERAFLKHTYSLDFSHTNTTLKKHRITTGIQIENQDNTIAGWGFLIPSFNAFTAGLYVLDAIKHNKNMQTTIALRYDYGLVHTKSYKEWFLSPKIDNALHYRSLSQDKKIHFKNYSGALGFSYTPENTTYKIHIGKSFRMPLAHELASNGVNYHMYRYEKGNMHLKPEQSYQLDLAVLYSSKKTSFSIEPFINYFDNLIYLNPTPFYTESLQQYAYTQAKVLRWGGEASLGYAIKNNLHLSGSIEYVYTKQKSGAKKGFTLPFSAPFSTVFSLEYQPKSIKRFYNTHFSLDYRITARQNRIVPPERKTPAYKVLDMRLSSEIRLFKKAPCVTIHAKIQNLFNAKYFNHTSFYRLIQVPEPGRNISITLTFPFSAMIKHL